MVSTNDIRPGQSIIVDDVIYQIMEYAHVKPGKGKAFVKTKLKKSHFIYLKSIIFLI